MTKEEIIKKTVNIFETFQIDGDKLYYTKQVLKIMDEYGRQCFEAGRKIKIIHDSINCTMKAYDIYDTYEDYLKEQENDT